MSGSVVEHGKVPSSQRREQILAAAEACFVRLGLEATRVEDILLEAGISRATFYRYYKSIDAVLMRLTVRAGREMIALAVRSSMSSQARPAQRIARVIAEMAARPFDPPILAMLAGSKELVRVSNMVMLSDEDMTVLADPLLPLLADAVASGKLRADVDADRMIEWLTRNATSIRFRLPPGAHSVEELEAYVMDFVMPALFAPPPTAPVVTTANDLLEPVIHRLERIERQLAEWAPHFTR